MGDRLLAWLHHHRRRSSENTDVCLRQNYHRRSQGIGHVAPIILFSFLVATIPATAALAARTPSPPMALAALRASSISQASTSARGVTAHTINVVFPIANLNQLASRLGFETDVEFSEQVEAIRLFVKTINEKGGINGRSINPIIAGFDPTNDAQMRALCKDWTEGSPAAFAVLDGVGDWSGDNELCLTREGHTPFIGQWTTVTDWTGLGAPYLWWTGPDDAAILQATVDWGLNAKLLAGNVKVGVIAGDRASDQLALTKYLLPDLARAGVTPTVETIAANPSEAASTQSEAPLIIEKLRAAGVTALIPVIPFNVFFPVLEAQTQQDYYPRLLLSDYESSIQSALGLIPVPFDKALNGQEGVTTETLGGVDDSRPQADGGYDPGDRSCFAIWHKAYPQIPKGNQNFYIEEQGPIQGWCQEIRLFATAATAAGRDLNRRTFVQAMAKISHFAGGYSPIFTFGPNKAFGPTEYQVVKLHVNEPPTSQCKLPLDHIPQTVCWVSVAPFRPLPSG